MMIQKISPINQHPYVQSGDGFTPLHACVQSNMPRHIISLLNAGADVNAQNKYGTTPLHCAMTSRCLESIDTLVRFGANVHARQCMGRTPLHFVIATLAIDKIITVSRSEERNLPFIFTPDWGESEKLAVTCVKRLLNYGADVNAVDEYGNTILHYSVGGHTIEFIKTLIEMRCNVDAKNNMGYTASELAYRCNRPTVGIILKNEQSASNEFLKTKF